ncbi:HupE/UreJ family protein [Massilia pseudoviolaceinigra]|uniref:HupE/UreJ family protein n=1 Tax=Massilia pseudoviolaceinigra TaxID=3057165 RepID=UPI002796997B|nr:HupE/UreJ family protein [Massilia sp. CCM 9206]MDQ1923516.1 HupE/UreJ family protein [Massilia sp. CCM 9206]
MKKTLAFALCLLALPAAAHPGHDVVAGFAAGLAHPFGGIDHLLAMLGVGLWSRQQGRGALLPVFVLMMALGAAVQVGVPIEAGLAATVVLIGALLAGAARVPAALAMALVAGFALLHGQAHGRELLGVASAAGFLSASAVLLAAGYAAGRARVTRLAGAAIGAAGVLLLAAVA